VTITKWRTEWSRITCRTGYGTECRLPLPDAARSTSKKPPDTLPMLQTLMATWRSSRNTHKPQKYRVQMRTQANRITCRRSDFNYYPKSRLHCYPSRKAIANQDKEVIDRLTNCQKVWHSHGGWVKSYQRINRPPGGILPRNVLRIYPKVDQQVFQVDQEATEAA
jgi:hypothetical protein